MTRAQNDLHEVLSVVSMMRSELTAMRGEYATKEDLKALLPRETYEAYHRQVVDAEKANADDIRDLRQRHDILERDFHTSQLSERDALGGVTISAQRDMSRQRATIDDRTLQWLMTLLISLAVGFAVHFIH